jgi:putative MATE family efflux protein
MLFRTSIIIFGTVLRAVGDTKAPMKVGIWMNVINVVLNFLLIYPGRTLTIFGVSFWMPGAGWGVVGAGIASAVAFAAGGVILTVRYLRHKVISPLGLSIKPDMQVLLPCLKVALPNCLQRFGTSLGFVVFASMINSLGDISTAAHTIANTVESAFYIPGFGMQTAAATLAGTAWGARDRQRIRDLTKMIIPIEVMLMVISGTSLFILAPSMMGLFTQDHQVILLGTVVLRMVAISEPFYGVSIIIEGMMQGMGNTMVPFVCNISCMWGIRIVGTFICTKLLSLGLVSAWGCMIGHNLVLFSAFLFLCVTGRYIPKNNAEKVGNF